jgi:hypothetical protein
VVTLLPRPEEAAVDALQPIAEPAHLEEVPTSTGTKRPQRQAVRSAAAPKRK